MPWNSKLYPADWQQIRLRILKRAGNCCEGSPGYPRCRAENGKPHPVTGSTVVLTIAHLDHKPVTRDESLLRAWCQRCHLTYDGKLHSRHAAQTRWRKKSDPKQEDLFS